METHSVSREATMCTLVAQRERDLIVDGMCCNILISMSLNDVFVLALRQQDCRHYFGRLSLSTQVTMASTTNLTSKQSITWYSKYSIGRDSFLPKKTNYKSKHFTVRMTIIKVEVLLTIPISKQKQTAGSLTMHIRKPNP